MPTKGCIILATSYINLIGKSRFTKHLFVTDDAFGASKFKASIWLDEENLNKYNKSGIQVSVKTDEIGPYVTLSRDDTKMIKKTLVYFTPPYIKNKDTSYRVSYVDEDNNIVRQYQNPQDKDKIQRIGDPFLIGNGSLLELNICIFDTQTKGKGHRLEGVRILDLIEYKPQERTEKPTEEEVPQTVIVDSNLSEAPVKAKRRPAF